MVSGKIVRVEKVVISGVDLYIVQLMNTHHELVWSSDALPKSAATDQLLEIGLPAWKIPRKFEEAEAEALSKMVSAA